MSWKDIFTTAKTSEAFIVQLHDQASLVTQMSDILIAYVTSTDDSQRTAQAAAAAAIESQATAQRRQILSLLNQTFVTPFDREDINDLSQIMEDMINYGDITIRELELYQIVINPLILDMAHHLQNGSQDLYQAVQILSSDPLQAQQHALSAMTMQNDMADLYRHAILSLGNETDMHAIIKMREVYRHMQNTAERMAAAGSLVLRITVKRYG
ncbi:MAG: hypothetical protein C7B46_16050 [Sulfobacillus benefaciens]|uniref:DUF47 domain-containing protein n=1 Tax=Sulfobacillus benefaciens TaxID=453960 RepID=A0A2T2XC42_9FIRM|nr:MAG: hypothetical protein C7B46_16050 [Sulfobacillus benefaciens]